MLGIHSLRDATPEAVDQRLARRTAAPTRIIASPRTPGWRPWSSRGQDANPVPCYQSQPSLRDDHEVSKLDAAVAGSSGAGA